jgi:8-oxo-dGTP diphosphatase
MSDLRPPLRVVCALIERDGHVLMAQRPAHKHLGGKWEFPGGKIEPGETPADALHRELHEELGVTVTLLRALAPHTHAYPTVTIELIPFVVCLTAESPAPQTHEHAALRWVPSAELLSLDLPEADLPVIADYLRRSL